eukprot:6203671-Pleurochrysis_carterae.AAC.1
MPELVGVLDDSDSDMRLEAVHLVASFLGGHGGRGKLIDNTAELMRIIGKFAAMLGDEDEFVRGRVFK